MDARAGSVFGWKCAVFVVSLGALPFVAESVLEYTPTIELVLFIALIMFGDLVEVRLPLGSCSISSVASFCAVLLFDRHFAVLSIVAASVIEAVIHNRDWYKAVFNGGQLVLVVVAGWTTFRLLGGSDVNLLSTKGLLFALLTWVVYFLTNVGLVALGFRCAERRTWTEIWRGLVRPTLPATPVQGVIGLTLAAAYQSGGPVTLVLFIGLYTIAYVALLSSSVMAKNQVLAERYEDTQAYLRDLVAGMLNGVVAVDPGGKVTMVNRAAEGLLGCREESLVGRPLAGVGEPSLPALMEQVLETGKGIPVRELRLEAAGRRIEAVCSVSVLRDASGKLSGAVAVLQDVTEQKGIERRLSHLDRLALMGEFAAGVVHEINNPLALIGMALDNAGAAAIDGEASDVVASLESAKRSLGRLERLSRQLLSFSRPVPTEVSSIDVGETLNGVLNIVAPQARIARVRVTRDVPAGLELSAEASALEQIFLNLAANAVQAMPDGGVLHVSAGRAVTRWADVVEGKVPGVGGGDSPGTQAVRILGPVQPALAGRKRGFVWVRFSDTGIGMSPQALQRLGQSFFTTKEKGTGLGIAVVSKILAQYRGVMEVWSLEGVGTTFRVWFPELTRSELEDVGDSLRAGAVAYRELQAAEGQVAAGAVEVARETPDAVWTVWTGLVPSLTGEDPKSKKP